MSHKLSSGRGKKPIKVVLDTNVLISALLFHGKLGSIQELIEAGLITPCFVVSTFREFQNVLAYPKFKSALTTSGLTSALLVELVASHSLIFADPETIPSITEDIPDNYILACASAARAAYIVTGDKLLLTLKIFEGIPLLAPHDFLKKIC